MIVKPEIYNIIVKNKAIFKIFLQNNMDREIAEIMLLAESPVFDFLITPQKMRIPKGARVYFSVTMIPKKTTKTGRYPVKFRLVGGGREFKSFGLDIESNENQPELPVSVPSRKDEGAGELLEVHPILIPPIVDGHLNDECWKNSKVISNFASMSGGKALYQTLVFMNYDKKSLYFGIYCMDSTMAVPSKEDKVSIFLAKNSTGYYLFDFFFNGSSYKKYLNREPVNGWNPSDIKYSLRKLEKAWECEISIPFEALDSVPPSAKKKWFLRIERVKSGGESESSFWAADLSGYHNKKGFGEFLIIP